MVAFFRVWAYSAGTVNHAEERYLLAVNLAFSDVEDKSFVSGNLHGIVYIFSMFFLTPAIYYCIIADSDCTWTFGKNLIRFLREYIV